MNQIKKTAGKFVEFMLKRLPYSGERIVNRSYQLRVSQVEWIDALAKASGMDKSEVVRAIIDFAMKEEAE